MTPVLNGHAQTKPDPLAGLASRLTDPDDREAYAAILSYVRALPPTDEFRQLADMLGFLSLLGQHVPDALREFLLELREQTKAAGEYHAQLDQRLARLPQEIAAGVDAAQIAKAMSESFRQQVTATGLADAAALLNASAADCKAVSANIAITLKLPQQYKGVAATISAELEKLTAASRDLRQHNARLLEQEREASWLWIGAISLVVFLAGGLCGTLFENGETADVLNNINAQIQRIQVLAASPAVSPSPTRRGRNK